jgi:hypothetical protein
MEEKVLLAPAKNESPAIQHSDRNTEKIETQ